MMGNMKEQVEVLFSNFSIPSTKAEMKRECVSSVPLTKGEEKDVKSTGSDGGEKTRKVKVCTVVDPVILKKIKLIGVNEGMVLCDVIGQALSDYVKMYEKR